MALFCFAAKVVCPWCMYRLTPPYDPKITDPLDASNFAAQTEDVRVVPYDGDGLPFDTF